MSAAERNITRAIDWLYLPFIRRFIPLQTFRYAVVGAINMAFSWVLFYLLYHYIFDEADFDMGIVVLSAPVASMCVVFPINFFCGFLLNKYVAFKHSYLRGRTQLMRYGLSVAGSLILNYLLLKLFHDAIGIFATPSQMLATIIVTVYSYLMQKYFTFSGSEE